MSTKKSAGLQDSGTTDEPTIEGPIPEFDKYGRYTGADYYRCAGCGTEAMRRRDLAGGCRCHR
jgi:hypothetical protein